MKQKRYPLRGAIIFVIIGTTLPLYSDFGSGLNPVVAVIVGGIYGLALGAFLGRIYEKLKNNK